MSYEKQDNSKPKTPLETSSATPNGYLEHQQLSDELAKGLGLLESLRPINVDTIKDSCITELKKFVAARGQIDSKTGKVYVAMALSSNPNTSTIEKQIKKADELLKEIGETKTIEELNHLLHKAGTMTNKQEDLDATIGKCLIIAAVANTISTNGLS